MEKARKTKLQNLCDTKTEVFNSKTKKCVKRTGAVGKSILARYQQLDDARDMKYRAANPTDADAEYRVRYSLCTTKHPIKCRIPTKKEVEYLIEKDVRPALDLEDGGFKVIKIGDDGVVVYRVGGRSHYELGSHLFDSPDDDGNYPIGKYLFNAEVLGYRLRPRGAALPVAESSVNCPRDKILNPETNRCVLKTGAIGKRILASNSKSQSHGSQKEKAMPVKKKRVHVFDTDGDTDDDEDCVPQTTAKYVNRNGPPYEGNWPGCHNKYRSGNDGELYQSRANSNNIFSWKKA